LQLLPSAAGAHPGPRAANSPPSAPIMASGWATATVDALTRLLDSARIPTGPRQATGSCSRTRTAYSLSAATVAGCGGSTRAAPSCTAPPGRRDGQQIAFVRNGDGPNSGLYTASLTGNSRPLRVTRTWCPTCDEEDDPPNLYGVSW